MVVVLSPVNLHTLGNLTEEASSARGPNCAEVLILCGSKTTKP